MELGRKGETEASTVNLAPCSWASVCKKGVNRTHGHTPTNTKKKKTQSKSDVGTKTITNLLNYNSMVFSRRHLFTSDISQSLLSELEESLFS